MDISRHSSIFTPEMLRDVPVHIIGCGATGSALAYSLCKLGVPQLHLYDADNVEIHNCANQMFTYADKGKNKAQRLKEILCSMLSYEEAKIEAHPEFVTKDSGHMLRGIIFNLVDSMDARRDIYKTYVRANFSCKHYFETRMGLKVLRAYSIDGTSFDECQEYEDTLSYNDSEAEVSACGTSQTAFPTANMTANTAVWMLLGWLNKEDVPNEVIIDMPTFNVMSRYFGEFVPDAKDKYFSEE